MKPEGIARTLKKTVPARKPVLLAGPPGVGKTSIARQVADELKYDLIVTHPVVEDPTDAKGMPWVAEDKKSAVFLPFGQLNKLLNATKPTLWLMDDVGQATQATQAANMQWLLGGEVQGKKLPACVSLLAATNRKQDRAGVQGLLEPVKSRFVTILHVEEDLNQWCHWALSNGVPVRLVAFLRLKKKYLLVPQPTADMVNSPSPRTWEHLGELLNLDLDERDRPEAFAGAVGKAHADEYLAFDRLFTQVPNPDAVLCKPETAVVPEVADIAWALATALIERVNPSNFGRFATYAERLRNADKAEFAAVMMRGALNACPEIQHTDEFTRVAVTKSELMFADL
jgi:hypothetical protein